MGEERTETQSELSKSISLHGWKLQRKKKMANISVVGCLHMLINVFLYQDICSM